jgi:hypothetical protein
MHEERTSVHAVTLVIQILCCVMGACMELARQHFIRMESFFALAFLLSLVLLLVIEIINRIKQ